MESFPENLSEEPYGPYIIAEPVVRETTDFLRKIADPNLKFEEWKKLCAEFEQKARSNQEYRLAYLKQSTKNPDMYVLAEIHQLESDLRKNCK